MTDGSERSASSRGRPTMKDVAREAGVSLKTVSRAVNGVPTLDPALAERVFEAIRMLGYRRNEVAATLRSSASTATIGLIIGDLRNPFYSSVAAGTYEIAREHATHLITASAEEQVELEKELALALCQRRVDGLLIVPAIGDQSYLQAEMDLGTSVVFLDREATGVTGDRVRLDNAAAGHALASMVLEEGHRRVGLLLDSLENSSIRERFEGVRAAFAEANMTLDDRLISTSAHEPEAATKATVTMLDAADPPTAFIGKNNRAIVGIVDALVAREARARVVGFDDFEMSRFLPRPVTLASFDAVELGRRGATRLFDRIGGKAGEPAIDLLPFTIVQRGAYR
jgi:LacI family transcriptional regulator